MGAILEKMVGINKWQKVFVEVILLFMTIKARSTSLRWEGTVRPRS
ncbi:MAG: hypothetical protein IPJ13_13725 [Saprospiraceae bacterium]|nr:hypothetical protein [Saprospiraceae bacterium]